MLKLIKADLTAILRLAGEHRPIKRRSVERSISVLLQCQDADYLFLARYESCRLSDLPTVYEPGTAANRDWLACRKAVLCPVIALYLHADRIMDGMPWGSVTLLNSRRAAEDVHTCAALPESQRERHIRQLVKRYQTHVRYCSTLEVIQYLKTGGESLWM